jgi:putative metallohydrolase (TIGR04338 family)
MTSDKAPRDNQKSRVYAAGRAIILDSRWLDSLEQMQQFVDHVTADPRWSGPRHISVRLARVDSRISTCYDDGHGGIAISPRYGANVLIVLHELAHALVTEGAHHSPEFCRVWLKLVARHGAPGEAGRLEKAMDDAHVRR